MRFTPKAEQQILNLLGKLRLWKPAVLYCHGLKMLDAGKVDAAKAEFILAHQRAPAWAAPHLQLAHCSEVQGNADFQELHLYLALQCQPNHARAEKLLMKLRAWRHEPVMKGWHLYYSAQPAQAILAFEKAQQQVGQRVASHAAAEIQAGLGWCWHDQQNGQRAIPHFQLAVEQQPDLGHAWKGLGFSFYQTHQIPEAVQALKQALRVNPQAQEVRSMLGWCAYAAEDFEQAEAEFELALQKNPLLGDAWWGVAWCSWRQQEVETARRAFIQAWIHLPKHPSAPKAAAILAADPRYVDLLQAPAGSSLDPGVAASFDFVGSPGLHTRDGKTRNGFEGIWDAMQALQVGQLEIAWQKLADLSNGATSAWPGRWQVALLKARVKRAQAETNDAEKYFQEACQIAPHRADAAHELGQLLNQLDRGAEARRLLQQYPNLMRTA
ncbi:MAG: tetratricopeptide repeat protein [Planctomycetes bacterium]|nr:tetratricopeptide repeat protein [Planctomycetota bacterium]